MHQTSLWLLGQDSCERGAKGPLSPHVLWRGHCCHLGAKKETAKGRAWVIFWYKKHLLSTCSVLSTMPNSLHTSSYWILMTALWGSTVISPTVQIQNAGLREGKWLTQGHTASKCQCLDLKPDLADSSTPTMTLECLLHAYITVIWGCWEELHVKRFNR